ncbi:MAG: HipB protein @ Antitoxin HigA [uncultured Paraburkholderia sp.]|nr:MAG: HipB protein @ Antitoxin HigA [uncultured Paraburkholderia sp.]CAH2944402.1 MAG: HipB protein @ Antitoxin HigA [uncultured Paraburkholderia sp.]
MDYPVKTSSQLRPLLIGFRKAAGLTQADMAARLGVTQQTYAQLEAKPESTSMERFFKALRLLKVDLVLSRPAGSGSTSELAASKPERSQAVKAAASSASRNGGNGGNGGNGRGQPPKSARTTTANTAKITEKAVAKVARPTSTGTQVKASAKTKVKTQSRNPASPKNSAPRAKTAAATAPAPRTRKREDW